MGNQRIHIAVAFMLLTLGGRPGVAAPGSQEQPEPSQAPSEPVIEVVDPPALAKDALPELTPAADEPQEFTEIKSRLLQGDSSSRIVKALQKLTYKHPKNAEVPYLLGQLYLGKLWVDDGLKLFRKAIELKPEFRSNPFLIRAVINGLSNDRDAGQVRRFLVQVIGRPATPYVQEVLYGEARQQVKERAASILSEIGSASR